MSWSHIQGTGIQSTANITSLSCTITGVAIGNTLISGLSGFLNQFSNTLTPSDNKGNSWSIDTPQPDSSHHMFAAIGHTVANVAGSVIVTWTITGGTGQTGFLTMSIDEYGGGGNAPTIGTIGGIQTDSQTTLRTIGMTFTGTDLVYVSAYETVTSDTVTYNNSGVARYFAPTISSISVGIATADWVSTTSFSVGISSTNNGISSAVAVAFQANSVGGLFLPATLSLGSGGPFYQSGANN